MAGTVSDLGKAAGLSPDQAQSILETLVEQQQLSADDLEAITSGGLESITRVGRGAVIFSDSVKCAAIFVKNVM